MWRIQTTNIKSEGALIKVFGQILNLFFCYHPDLFSCQHAPNNKQQSLRYCSHQIALAARTTTLARKLCTHAYLRKVSAAHKQSHRTTAMSTCMEMDLQNASSILKLKYMLKNIWPVYHMQSQNLSLSMFLRSLIISSFPTFVAWNLSGVIVVAMETCWPVGEARVSPMTISGVVGATEPSRSAVSDDIAASLQRLEGVLFISAQLVCIAAAGQAS